MSRDMVKKRRINRKTFRLVLLPATAVVILMASAGVAMHRYPYTVRYEVSHNSQEGIEGAQAIAAATPGMEVPQAWADKVFGMLDDELKGIFVRFDTSLKIN